jgi:hypothetical protein
MEHFPEKWKPVFRRKCDQLKSHWCPCEDSNPALPLTRRLHRRQCFKGGASRRNQTSVSSLRGTCSLTELCRQSDSRKLTNGRAFCFASQNGRQLHNAASNSFGRSRCQTTRSSRIAFPVSGKAPPCRVRMRTRFGQRRRPCGRISCAQHERRHNCDGVSCDILGRSCPPACLAEGFLALPPVSPVFLTLVRVYSSVG